jgi:hypothetical protein
MSFRRIRMAGRWGGMSEKVPVSHCICLEGMTTIGETSIRIAPPNALRLPVAPGPGVYSASNRNEYQKQKNNNVSGE